MKISEEAFIHSYEPQLFKHLQKVHFPENSRNDSIGQEFPSVDSKVNFGILIHFHCVGNCVPLLIRICTSHLDGNLHTPPTFVSCFDYMVLKITLNIVHNAFMRIFWCILVYVIKKFPSLYMILTLQEVYHLHLYFILFWLKSSLIQ